MSFLIHWLAAALQWVFTWIVALPLHILVLLLAGLAKLIGWIPGCSCFANVAGYVSSLPPWVAHIGAAMQLKYGMQSMLCALVLRWILRRIPFIG